MTARVVPIRRAAGRGRQPAAIERIRDQHDELRVVAEESLDFAVAAVHLARRIETALVEGRLGLVAQFADEIERRGNHATVRAKAAAAIAKLAQAEANGTCPDATLVPLPGHGAAA